MIGRKVALERKLIEQRGLLNSLMSHHDSVLSQQLNQRRSTGATEAFFNTIGRASSHDNPRHWADWRHCGETYRADHRPALAA
jgi:hypothetical protein